MVKNKSLFAKLLLSAIVIITLIGLIISNIFINNADSTEGDSGKVHFRVVEKNK